MGDRIFQLEVEATGAEPVRLDVYVASALKELTRSRIQKLIAGGLVTVDGVAVRPSHKLRGGEALVVTLPAAAPLKLAAQAIALAIVYEDASLVVVNKPAGLVVHPGAGVSEGTLVNALLHHCAGTLSGISGALRPGIVHRLDKDTSGLLVVAKEDRAHLSLTEQIRSRTARRTYIALVEGIVPEDGGVIDRPIGRHPVRRKEMAVVEHGRSAVTRYEVLRRFSKYTLVKASLETGRTHQIRVHMAYRGYPVVGDLVYNRKASAAQERRRFGLKGHALHAYQLSFRHPITNVLLEFEAPLPSEFQRLIDSLGA